MLSEAQTLSAESSEELVSRARQGDRMAFEELYHRYYPPVARRLSHLGGPSAPVSDLAQETFAQAYRSLRRFRGDSPFSHWVMRIATNVARTHYRRGRRSIWRLWDRPEAEQAVPAPGARVDESYPTLHAVHRALEGLSTTLREAVILFELEGLSLAEMAATLDVPLHTAASRVRRGREQLRAILERMGYAATPVAAAVLCGGGPH
jgi:RNA polymerase sigma-70 factor (ECF subfamily)